MSRSQGTRGATANVLLASETGEERKRCGGGAGRGSDARYRLRSAREPLRSTHLMLVRIYATARIRRSNNGRLARPYLRLASSISQNVGAHRCAAEGLTTAYMKCCRQRHPDSATICRSIPMSTI